MLGRTERRGIDWEEDWRDRKGEPTQLWLEIFAKYPTLNVAILASFHREITERSPKDCRGHSL